jgi:hypothetical protein
VSQLAFRPFRGVQQLLIATLNDHARPMIVIEYFVCFYTDQWVGTHPFDLLTEPGNTIEMPFVISEIHRHDIWSIVA